MEDDVKAKLDSVFKKHAASRQVAEEARQIGEDKRQTFMREFLAAREALMRPAMQEIGEYIKQQGYKYEITTEEEQIPANGRGRTIPASIRLTFFFGERTFQVHEHPGFMISANKESQRVSFYESNVSPGRGGSSGPAGDATLIELTKEVLQGRILKVVSEVFR